MSSSYKPEYPAGVEIDVGIKTFFEEFYKLSDTPEAHDQYANCFAKDATVVMGTKKVVGRPNILEFRKGMWAAVAGRLHTPFKIYSFGDNSHDIMLFGTVEYTFKDGKKLTIEWAGRANMVKEADTWKLGFYQVYMDPAAMRNAK